MVFKKSTDNRVSATDKEGNADMKKAGGRGRPKGQTGGGIKKKTNMA